MTNRTHCQKILAHLQRGYTLTPQEAWLKFGCYRLGARIYDLRQAAFPIESRRVKTASGAYVAQYWMD